MNQNGYLKKLFILIIVPIVLLLILVKPASAFETPDLDYQFQFEEALNSSEMNLQSFVNEVMKAAMAASTRFTIGAIFSPEESNQTETMNLNQNKNFGLISGTLFILSKAYDYQPASGIDYLANLPKRLIFAEKVEAEEGNFIEQLTVLQPIWTTFRNMAYLLFALILVFIGFAIMFRMKISPQAVVTIQAALPRIVIALILITFSYAIVGLMLDIMFFLNRTIGTIFEGLIQGTNWAAWREFLLGLFNFFSPSSSAGSFEGNGPVSVPYIGPAVTAFNTMGVGLSYFFIFINVIFPFVGIILTLILSIIIAIAMGRCLFVILKSITMIVINIIFAPLRILMGAMPGSTAINDWFKDLISNIFVLPLMLVIFYTSAYLIMASAPEATTQINFGGLRAFWKLMTMQPTGNITVLTVLPFCGIGLLLMAPKVSEIIQGMMTKKPFQYGSAIGEYGAMGSRIAQKGWQTVRDKTGMTTREEGARKAKVDREARKWEQQHTTP
jgi:hypothetical protein